MDPRALIGLAIGVALFIAFLRVVRRSHGANAAWPACARRLGLAFEKQHTVSVFTGAAQRLRSLEGTVHGVPIRVKATWQRIGLSTRRETVVSGRSSHVSPHQFCVQIGRAGPDAATYHVVPTDDHDFDRKVVLKSDAPNAVRALTQPEVRAAILKLPMDEVAIFVDRGEVRLWYEGEPTNLDWLEAPIQVVVAAAGVEAAVEPQHQVTSAASENAHVRQLASGHDFTEEALAANRGRQMHPTQVARRRGAGTVGLIVLLVLSVASLVAGVGGALYLYDDFSIGFSRTVDVWDRNGLILLAAGGALVSAVFGVVAIISFRKSRPIRDAYRAGCAELIEGPIHKIHISRRRQRDLYQYQIGRRRFDVPHAGWTVVVHGARYRVYFVADDLLSVEPAHEADASHAAGGDTPSSRT